MQCRDRRGWEPGRLRWPALLPSFRPLSPARPRAGRVDALPPPPRLTPGPFPGLEPLEIATCLSQVAELGESVRPRKERVRGKGLLWLPFSPPHFKTAGTGKPRARGSPSFRPASIA